jgi:hypothetical protein
MDINIYSARNQIAHERIQAATLLLAGVVTVPEESLDVLKRIKAQDQDVHSLYQREAIAGVLEAVAGHLGLYPLVEETLALADASPADASTESTESPADESAEDEDQATADASTEPASKRRRKGDKA